MSARKRSGAPSWRRRKRRPTGSRFCARPTTRPCATRNCWPRSTNRIRNSTRCPATSCSGWWRRPRRCRPQSLRTSAALSVSPDEAAMLDLLPLPHHDHPHRLVVDVGVRHRRALDVKPVALESDIAHLLAADPGFVPRRFDLGDDLAIVDAIAAGIGDHGFERLRAVRVGFRNCPALGCHQREPAAFRRRDLHTFRMLAIDWGAFLARDVLIDDRNERPGADDLSPQLGVAHRAHSAVQPPSSTSAEPVISEDASEARKTMAPESSSSWPRRPSLIFDKTSSRNALFSKNGFVIGVSRKVGPRLLTRMLCGASSIAIALVKPSMACFDAQ